MTTSISNLNLQDTKPDQRSKPEQWAEWLFKTCGSWRNILAFALVVALTYISIRFNYELGKLSAVDDTSKTLLPSGYALLDLSALFLSGYVGLKSRSPIRKAIAWVWFAFLLCLSLWAAAAFTMSVDYRQSLAPLETQIEQKKSELATQRASVETWQKNVAESVRFKTKHQGTLSREQIKETMLAGELAHLESQRVPPAHIIYERAAPYVGIDSTTLQLTIRLLWAAALTLSPIILVLLVAVEFGLVHVGGNRKQTHETDPTSPRDPTGNDDNRTRTLNRVRSDKHGQALHSNPYSNPIPQPSAKSKESVKAKRTETSPNGLTHIGPFTKDNATAVRSNKKGRARKTDSADTGVDSHKGNRYSDVKEQVQQGQLRPSKSAVKAYARCGQETALKYLAAMEEEGVILRQQNGRYKLASNVVSIKKSGGLA